MPGIRIPDPAPPWSGKQSVQSLGGEAVGCWEGQRGVSRKWSGGNGQVWLLGVASRKDGEEGGVGWDGTGCDGKGRVQGHTPP